MEMDAPHRHNEIELNLCRNAPLNYLFGGRIAEVLPGRLAVFWGAMPHQMVGRHHEHYQMQWVTVPLAWFLQWGLPTPFIDSILRGTVAMEPDFRASESDSKLLDRWALDLESGSSERQNAMTLELQARLIRMASALSDSSAEPVPTKQPQGSAGETQTVEEMTRWIALNYTESVKIADMAAQIGLHPNYAMTLFKKVMGLSIGEYVTQHRISHAQRLLATTDQKILDIALECGYGSASQFYAMFERVQKQSPREFRLSVRGQAE